MQWNTPSNPTSVSSTWSASPPPPPPPPPQNGELPRPEWEKANLELTKLDKGQTGNKPKEESIQSQKEQQPVDEQNQQWYNYQWYNQYYGGYNGPRPGYDYMYNQCPANMYPNNYGGMPPRGPPRGGPPRGPPPRGPPPAPPGPTPRQQPPLPPPAPGAFPQSPYRNTLPFRGNNKQARGSGGIRFNLPKRGNIHQSNNAFQTANSPKPQYPQKEVQSNVVKPESEESASTDPMAATGEWPQALKEYVQRCFAEATNDKEKDEMEKLLKEKLTFVFNRKLVNVINWNTEKLPWEKQHQTPNKDRKSRWDTNSNNDKARKTPSRGRGMLASTYNSSRLQRSSFSRRSRSRSRSQSGSSRSRSRSPRRDRRRKRQYSSDSNSSDSSQSSGHMSYQRSGRAWHKGRGRGRGAAQQGKDKKEKKNKKSGKSVNNIFHNYETPDKAERLQKRAARFADTLGSTKRRSGPLSLQINAFQKLEGPVAYVSIYQKEVIFTKVIMPFKLLIVQNPNIHRRKYRVML
jgi:hypothetical protein